MTNKSAAQIRRLQKRAEARGEEYHAPPSAALTTEASQQSNNSKDDIASTSSPNPFKTKLVALGIQIDKELTQIVNDEALNAKERRSAKRKAEAICVEAFKELIVSYEGEYGEMDEKWYKNEGEGITVEDLIALSKEFSKESEKINKKDSETEENASKGHNPYVVFIGQLAFTTTKEMIFNHFKEMLVSKNHKISDKSLVIRLLSDKKTKKSRGMAFLETDSPEILYDCLTMHQTFLDGRRINCERSAGGRKGSEKRQEKLKRYREEQKEYLESTVEQIIEEYKQKGDIRDDEFDKDCIDLCKRHRPATISAAIEQYLEARGGETDKPSAYFTRIVSRIAVEGVDSNPKKKKKETRHHGSW